MYGKASGLDRFKKAESLEPFSVNVNLSSRNVGQASSKVVGHSSAWLPPQSKNSVHQSQHQQQHGSQKGVGVEAAPLLGQNQHATQIGGGQSMWQPPDWAIEPRPGVFYLEVMKDGQVLDRINLDRRKHVFGRQIQTCDFVLDHQSVSRQHAAVVPHKNGRLAHIAFFFDILLCNGCFSI